MRRALITGASGAIARLAIPKSEIPTASLSA